ncbi:MAG: galactose mutarotase [Cytophagaceae bacterium]|nr:galactose mutarotase [Gemmatimonadaceae bacterium]
MPPAQALPIPALHRARWGTMPDGGVVEGFTLANQRGTRLAAITLGATITSLRVRGRDGECDDVVVGFDSVDTYLTRAQYFGAVAGRYANRIAGGRFTLDGVEHRLSTNEGVHHLHGGVRGFDRRLWSAEPVRHRRGPAVRFRLTSPDGEEGYPGTLRASVRYLLTHDDRLVIDYAARTTKPTIVNLTQHAYFNLAGRRAADVLGHELSIEADQYTPVDEGLIPEAAHAPVMGTPFDFRAPSPIGARIADPAPQLQRGGGYDHNFVLRRSTAGLELAARVHEPLSGRTLEVSTTEPGLQLYTGNHLDGTLADAQGRSLVRHGGVCLETQHFPDSPNRPEFPSTVLRPGGWYHSRTIFAFSVAEA